MAGLAALLVVQLGGCGGVVDQQAEKVLMGRLGELSVTVYPVFIRDGEQHRYDAASARALGAWLTEHRVGQVSYATAEVPITSRWGMNQARMLRDSIEDFRKFLLANPPPTEYALLAEYLYLGGEGGVGGVHLYLLDPSGRVAYVSLMNSHHAAFHSVKPRNRSAEDCTQIAVNALEKDILPKLK
jgi:hypothetical protein